MKLTFFGTRTLIDNRILKIIEKQINLLNPDIIITAGDAKGVCAMSILMAKKYSIPTKLYWLNRKKYGRGMYDRRSKEILKDSDFVIFIHDGKSKGTKNEIELAKMMKIKYKYFKIKENEYNITSFNMDNILFDY